MSMHANRFGRSKVILGRCVSAIAALCFTLITAGTAAAATVSLSWTAPTQNTDGSTIGTADAVTSYTILYGLCNGGALPASPQTQTVAAPALSASVTGLTAGLWCFAMTATNKLNLTSAQTNIATKTILASPPNPPGNLTIGAQTVYQFIGTADKVAMLPVGTAPANAPCDPAQAVIGYYVVPQAGIKIAWFGNVKPKVVFGQCS